MRILNINARYPGASHDSYIWGCSIISEFFEETFDETWEYCMLGDSGYPLQPWLITPFKRELNDGQKTFNKNHKRLRSLVERTIGLLKGRFRYNKVYLYFVKKR